MRICIAHISGIKQERSFGKEVELYVGRLGSYAPVEVWRERTEAALLERLAKHAGRTTTWLVLLDGRGEQISSEQLARVVERERDGGRQEIVFAIGPADGWSEKARERADLLLSFGPMTFPHELARVMLAEQIYRAFTILAGHPYHCGH
ncbi:MAG: 23S rRNA (pseudouridine(1915)-N(3))-methyltransferase RlmH [Acidobacteriaceae bacterium]